MFGSSTSKFFFGPAIFKLPCHALQHPGAHALHFQNCHVRPCISKDLMTHPPPPKLLCLALHHPSFLVRLHQPSIFVRTLKFQVLRQPCTLKVLMIGPASPTFYCRVDFSQTGVLIDQAVPDFNQAAA